MTGTSGPLTCAASLADIPAHRRAALVERIRRAIPGVDAAGIDAFIRDHAPTPCTVWPPGPFKSETDGALLGDDGRYHLIISGGILACSQPAGRRSRRRRAAGPIEEGTHPHHQQCHWWTDGTRHLVQPARGTPCDLGVFGKRTVSWDVQLAGPLIDPALVPGRKRCAPTSSGLQQGTNTAFGLLLDWWPPFAGPATPKGRIRARLIDEFGSSACQDCGRYHGSFIDHHHGTRMVGGLLCRHCNTHVDGCMHLAGCAWGDYLDHPPAAHLALRYPT